MGTIALLMGPLEPLAGVSCDVGARLRAAREKVELRQEDVATRLGIKHSSVSAWELGRSLPRADRLAELARIYKASADWLLCLSQDELMAVRVEDGRVMAPRDSTRTADLYSVPVLTGAATRQWAAAGYPPLARGLARVQASVALPLGAGIAVPVTNALMEPEIPRGAYAIVSRFHPVGQAAWVLADVGSGDPIIRQHVIDGPTAYLVAPNGRLPPIALDSAHRIIGRLLETVHHRSFLDGTS